MKGQLENMMAKARFTEGDYRVYYRDFKELISLPVAEFWKIAEIVPAHRIAMINLRITSATNPKIFDEEILYQSTDKALLALPVVHREKVDEETMRFVEMRDALAIKHPWQRYIELERVKRLEEEGRELLGELVYVFPKRDGENVSMWLEDVLEYVPHISSHNMVNADPSMITRFQTTSEYDKAVSLLASEKMNFGKNYILYGELVNKGKGPTRIEPTHKKAHWYLFDIYDTDTKSYLPYPLLYQTAYHYHLPVIEAIEIWTPWKMEDLPPKIEEWKAWAKRHRREGVVLKVYKNGQLIGAKEKIDLPDLPPIPRKIAEKATFPPMPEDRVLRALQHAWDEINQEQEINITGETAMDRWRDKAIAMPIIAKHIAAEGREHRFNPPRNIYEIYINTPIEAIREHPNE